MNESIEALIAKWHKVAEEAAQRSARCWTNAARQYDIGKSEALCACAEELEELCKQLQESQD